MTLVSLVDIVPQKRNVQISAGEIELHGLGLRHIADLFLDFPSLRSLFAAGGPDVTAAELIVQAPEAIGTIIGMAADQPEAAENIAKAMNGEEVEDCLEAIRDLTFPRGLAPFLERLTGLVNLSPGPLSGRAPAMNAPPPLNSSSPPDMLAAK